ncbi:GMC oxidoreductase [Microbulbifer litoralis]|uniref:GMC oxidoreductase n=1 Tax=Microbulbifer litoralis TaxID=2933965 RepID=UPI002027FC2F|nr:GMC oxidoreductase [Microbulbifer sp. GX H0434]
MSEKFDFDQIVIGSGFGGSCSALRLSEKGHHVLVLEKGKRWKDKDFSNNSWNLKKFLWAPKLGLTGNIQLTMTRKITAIHGAGVGGGSLVYANVHLIPKDEVFESTPWSRVHRDWKKRLMPFYGLAQRMIGVTKNPYSNAADEALLETARRMGREETYQSVNTGVLFAEDPKDGSGKERGDPYFDGEGPQRNNCIYCGGCTMGCRHNAKNTLEKNYLWFAERNEVEIRPESEVTRIEPLPDENGVRDGSAGYELTIQSSTALLFKKPYKLRTRGVVVSGGVFGTIPLLMKARDKDRTLPNISQQLGRQVRTNSETLIVATSKFSDAEGKPQEICHGPTITSMFDPDDETRMEINRFPRYGDLNFALQSAVPLTESNGRIPRQISMLINILRQPIKTLRMLNPIGKSRNSIIFLVMQTKDSFVHVKSRKWPSGWRVTQEPGDSPLSNYFPVAHEAARHYVEAAGGGDAGNVVTEVLSGAPSTAHLMGGVAIGTSAENGVVDETGAVFGYQNLRVMDGSLIPGNLGVNPSLTILALSEYAWSKVPVFNRERAEKTIPVTFSKPLPGMVSELTGTGDLHSIICRSGKQSTQATFKASSE